MTGSTITSAVMLALLLVVVLAVIPAEALQGRRSSMRHRPPPPPPPPLDDRPRRLADRPDMVTMIPQQSCYYQSYNKRLTCVCNSTETAAYLNLKMMYYVSDRSGGNHDIRSVFLQQCKELLVVLDLQKVDASRFPISFRSIMKVQVEKIVFEPLYSVQQQLQLEFYNVEQLIFKRVFVEDTLKLRARNVKEARFVKSNFAHIPSRGFEISNAKLLEIRDNIFWRVSPESIQVSDVAALFRLRHLAKVG